LSKFTEQTNWHGPRGPRGGYLTTAELVWEIGKVGSGLWLRVRPDFYFDVSVPLLVRWLFDPSDPRYRKASALHDYALSLGWDRVASAAVFNSALKASGVGSVERLAMTLGVISWRWK